MKKIYALSLIVLTIALMSCKQETCPVSCSNGGTYYVAVGFTKAELSGAKNIISYMINSSYRNDTSAMGNWSYPSSDTTSDSLIAQVFEGGPNTSPLEIFIPALNSVYKITSFKYSGNLTEKVDCFEGGKYGSTPVGPACSNSPLYLQSYSVNGVTITAPKPADTTGLTLGYIYFHK